MIQNKTLSVQTRALHSTLFYYDVAIHSDEGGRRVACGEHSKPLTSWPKCHSKLVSESYGC